MYGDAFGRCWIERTKLEGMREVLFVWLAMPLPSSSSGFNCITRALEGSAGVLLGGFLEACRE